MVSCAEYRGKGVSILVHTVLFWFKFVCLTTSPSNHNFMEKLKRFSSGFLMLVLLFSLSGCTDYAGNVDVQSADQVIEQSVVEGEVAVDPVIEVAPSEVPVVKSTKVELPTKVIQKSVVTQPVEEKQVVEPVGEVNHYVNVDDDTIQSPTYYPSEPAGATARCGDGTYSFSAHRSGTCSHHDGVASWL